MYDVLIKNGRIVTADAVTEGNIAVKEGRIAAVLTALAYMYYLKIS